jgi:hypothetical protein
VDGAGWSRRDRKVAEEGARGFCASGRPWGWRSKAALAAASRSRGGGAAKAVVGVTTAVDRSDVVGADQQSCSLRVWSGADTERNERDGMVGR